MMGMLEIAQVSSLRLTYSSSEGATGEDVGHEHYESTTYGEAQ
jgi:hypothetical protein